MNMFEKDKVDILNFIESHNLVMVHPNPPKNCQHQNQETVMWKKGRSNFMLKQRCIDCWEILGSKP